MKKAWMALLLSLVLVLGGCSAPEEDTRPEEETPPAQTSAAQPDPDTQQTASPQPEDTGAGVVNNGSYFVKVDNWVYYRLAGEHALSNTSTFGDFLEETNQRDFRQADYMHSTLCRYDEGTGQQETVAEDYGKGALYYSNGWIYSNRYEWGTDEQWVYRTNVVTGQTEDLCTGTLTGVSEDGEELLIFVHEDHESFTRVYRDGACIGEIKVPGHDGAQLCGTSGGYAFLMTSDYDLHEYLIWCAPLDRPEEVLLVGQIPCPAGDGEECTFYPTATQVLAQGDTAYLSLSYYQDSVYSRGYVCRADLTREGSVEILTKVDGAKNPGEVYLWLEDGQLKTGHGIPGRVEYDGEGRSILQYDGQGEAQVVFADVVNEPDRETLISEEIARVYRADGGYYLIRHVILEDLSQSIGMWSTYNRVHTYYERIGEDGQKTLLGSTPGTPELTAYVAFGEQADVIYYQPVYAYVDYMNRHREDAADVLVKGELSMEQGSPLSELDGYGVETCTGEQLEKGSDGSYLVPEGFGGSAPVRFRLYFDGDGKICAITPDAAG